MVLVIVMASLVSIPARLIFSVPTLSESGHVSGRFRLRSPLEATVAKNILKYMTIANLFIVSSAGLPVWVTDGRYKGYKSWKVDTILLPQNHRVL